jgi:magnesium transporter
MPAAVADEVLRRLRFQGDISDEPYDAVPYAPDSVGSMMDSKVVKINQNATVAEALAAIRAAGIDEDLHAVFVVDEQGRYIGNLHVRLLLTRPEQTRIESLVDRDSMFVRVDAHREEVRHLIRTHNLSAVPVLDHEDQLVGRVLRNGE